eukprot:351457-Chlamydomonas_euryale.AAC.3
MTSICSAAKPSSLQRVPFTSPRPRPTALPGYWSNTRKGCTQHEPILPGRALDRVIRPTCWVVQFQGSKVFKSVPQSYLSKACSAGGAATARISGHGVNLNWSQVDKFGSASLLENVAKRGATTGAFLIAPPDCRAVHVRNTFDIM